MRDGDDGSKSTGFQLPQFAAEELAKPQKYLDVAAAIQNALLSQEIPSVDAKRMLDTIRENCKNFTGFELSDIARRRLNPIERFRGLLQSSEKELREVQSSIRQIRNLRGDEKKGALALIEETISLQAECRVDPAKFWTYVGRDSATNEVIRWERFQLEFYDIWNDAEYPNSLVEAPPGHGKSTNFMAQAAFEIVHDPKLRHLFLLDNERKAKRTAGLLRRILCSDRCRALFPKIHVETRADGARDDALEFCVRRPNWESREPTVEASGIKANINGNGFDRIWGDDFTPPGVRVIDSLRQEINGIWFNVCDDRIRVPEIARIRIIHTPWHEHDTCGLIERNATEGRDPDWRIAKFPIRDDEQGMPIPLWARFSAKYLQKKKISVGGNYDCRYRLRVRTEQSQTVKHVRYYNAEWDGELTTDKDRALLDAIAQGEQFLSIDPSATSAKHSSYHGALHIALLDSGRAFVRRIWLLRLNPTSMQAWIILHIYDQPTPGYSAIQIESQGGMAGQASMWVAGIRHALETGQIPVMDGDRMRIEEREPYTGRIPEFITTGTNMEGISQNVDKKRRLIQSAPALENGIVALAGKRTMNHRTGEIYLGPEPDSDMQALGGYLVNFDSATITDGVDGLTQWILYNADRLQALGIEETEGEIQTDDDLIAARQRHFKLAMERADKDRDENSDEEQLVLVGDDREFFGMGAESWN